MPNTHYFTADLTQFKSPTPAILFGETLKAVNTIRQSITAYGLLSPLTVVRKDAHLIVIDGHKRLAALRRMKFAGDLPRDLKTVPYLVVSNSDLQGSRLLDEPMPLLKNTEKHDLVERLVAKSSSPYIVAAKLFTTVDIITKLASINNLSMRLKSAFFLDELSLTQAYAFSTIENTTAQERLLDMLGSYIDAPSIIKAIESGAAVVDCGNENLIFLPSRPSRTDVIASAA